MLKVLSKIVLLSSIVTLPIELMAENINSPLIISVQKDVISCDKKIERYTEIYRNISLSDKYIILSSKKFDINRDGKEDFLAVVISP